MRFYEPMVGAYTGRPKSTVLSVPAFCPSAVYQPGNTLPPSDLISSRVWRASRIPLRDVWRDVPSGFARTLESEFTNRLDCPASYNTESVAIACGRLLLPRIEQWSRAELRAALEQILTACGLPPISSAFAVHNAAVDARCKRFVGETLRPVTTQTASAWLRRLAASNLIEVWPGGAETAALRALNTTDLPLPEAHDEFQVLADRFEKQMSRQSPIGLFTDNHGEVVFDMEFLRWAGRCFKGSVTVFPKACPVETDCDHATVRTMLGPKASPEVIPDGSRIQGNLLDRLSQPFLRELRQIRSRKGLLIVKGISNLESMAGLRIATLFLFAAKNERVARRFGVPVGAACGLWVPPGRPYDHPHCLFAFVPPASI